MLNDFVDEAKDQVWTRVRRDLSGQKDVESKGSRPIATPNSTPIGRSIAVPGRSHKAKEQVVFAHQHGRVAGITQN